MEDAWRGCTHQRSGTVHGFGTSSRLELPPQGGVDEHSVDRGALGARGSEKLGPPLAQLSAGDGKDGSIDPHAASSRGDRRSQALRSAQGVRSGSRVAQAPLREFGVDRPHEAHRGGLAGPVGGVPTAFLPPCARDRSGRCLGCWCRLAEDGAEHLVDAGDGPGRHEDDRRG